MTRSTTMKLAAFLALCLASLMLAACIIFAALGMPRCAIFSGCAVAWALLVAARESDAAQVSAEWEDARRHPRL